MSGVRSEVNNKIGATRRTVLYRYRSPRCLFTFTGTLVPCESRLPPDPPVSFYRYPVRLSCFVSKFVYRSRGNPAFQRWMVMVAATYAAASLHRQRERGVRSSACFWLPINTGRRRCPLDR